MWSEGDGCSGIAQMRGAAQRTKQTRCAAPRRRGARRCARRQERSRAHRCAAPCHRRRQSRRARSGRCKTSTHLVATGHGCLVCGLDGHSVAHKKERSTNSTQGAASGGVCQEYAVELEVYTSVFGGSRRAGACVCSSGEKQGRGIKQACRETHQPVAPAQAPQCRQGETGERLNNATGRAGWRHSYS